MPCVRTAWARIFYRADAVICGAETVLCGADAVRPYGIRFNPDNSVKMIGHDHKFIFKEMDFLSDLCRPEPFFLYDPSQGVDLHFSVHHLPKQTLPPQGDNRDVITSRVGIINSFQAGRAPAELSLCLPRFHLPSTILISASVKP